MCVIAHAAKKRYMKREEVKEAMRINSDGFFMAALRPDGTRDTIRTLDENEALSFFDDKVKEDDCFVMHARIPSRGAKSIANVHGWECDGILFMHNMTITEIDKMMTRVKWTGTDSEFFFKKIFIPFYRGLGAEAYKDKAFHPDLDNIITYFLGYNNKFCFIMPDNNVIRYGNWVTEPDRVEGGKNMFYASKSTYKVFHRAAAETGGGATKVAGFRGRRRSNPYSSLYGYDYDYEGYYGNGYLDDEDYGDTGYQGNTAAPAGNAGTAQGTGKKKSKKGKSAVQQGKQDAKPEKKSPFDGKALLELEGVEGVCKIALSHLVFKNVVECRQAYTEDETEKEVEKVLNELAPTCFSTSWFALKEALKRLSEEESMGFTPKAIKEYAKRFAETMAAEYEMPLVKSCTPYAQAPTQWALKIGLKQFENKMAVLFRMLNVKLRIDDPSVSVEDFVTAFVMETTGNDMAECCLEDLITPDNMTLTDAEATVQMLLCVIHGTVEDLFSEDETVVEGAETVSMTEVDADAEPAPIMTVTVEDAASDASEVEVEVEDDGTYDSDGSDDADDAATVDPADAADSADTELSDASAVTQDQKEDPQTAA